MAELLPDGEHIGQHLGGMEVVGQAVPHGHAGVLGQILHHALLEAAVLDAVVHAAQDLGGVGQGFLLAHLAGAGIQEGHAHAQVAGAYLEGAACPGGGLLKQQHDLLAAQPFVLHAGGLQTLELGGQVDEVVDLVGGVVQKSEEAPSSDVDAHGSSPPVSWFL